MSLVFAAENTVTNKQVALKFLLASAAERPDAKERLLREARASARIKHRNVVDVYDVGFEGETMFLVMDLLEGETLASVLETATMSVQTLLQRLIPAMRGVAEAHRQGVIHRDIKPDNVFLAREVDHHEPVVTVLDFGIAKVEGDSLRTHSGSATGTPVFMSTEQIRGLRDLDARVDVYGFGVILYVALCGRLPMTAETLPELIYKLTSSSAVPLSVLRPELPHALRQVVERAMAREREDRTPTLAQLIEELTPFAHTSADLGSTRLLRYGHDVEPMPATEPSIAITPSSDVELQQAMRTPIAQTSPPPRRWPVLAAVGLLAIAGASAGVLRGQSPVPAAKAHPHVQTPATPPPVAIEPALAAPPDAGAVNAAVLAPAVVRKPPVVRKVMKTEVVAPPAQSRRRLSAEDFFQP